MSKTSPCKILLCCLLTVATQAFSQTLPAEKGAAAKPPRNGRLRQELLRMEAEDQAIRKRGVAENWKNPDTFREVHDLDRKLTARLRAIIKEHGFPSARLVGKDGMEAAWLLIQHSQSLELKKEALPLLKKAAERGEFQMKEVAMLEDNVLGAEGKPQIYGTGFRLVDGKLVLYETIDRARLDERRAKVGLPPMAEYVRVLRESSGLPVVFDPPAAGNNPP